jgi:hypothetical protein
MSVKTSLYILIFFLFTYLLSIYYSGKNTSEREFSTMIESGNNDLAILENYLNHHDQKIDLNYDKALALAANLDVKYLDELIHYYTIGNLVLTTSSAELILQQLPSESIQLNYAAGRIYASREFNHYIPHKATRHLEYAAIRGDKNAAAIISELYALANCNAEAISWAKQANKQGARSDCAKLPVDIDQLNDKQLDIVIYNENEFEAAKKASRLPELHYSDACVLNE